MLSDIGPLFLEELVDEAQAVAASCARSFGFQPDDLGDCLQEFAVKVLMPGCLSALMSITGAGRRACLYSMANLHCRGFRRTLLRLASHNGGPIDDDLAQTFLDLSPGPEIEMLQDEVALEIRTLIGGLRSSCRTAIECFYLEGERVAEIAAHTNRSECAVRKSLCVGRRIMLKLLVQAGWSPETASEALRLLSWR